LTHLVDTAEENIRIVLHTTIPDIPKQTIEPANNNHPVKELEIRVLTPAFYSRFIHYAHTSEAFDRECIFTDEKNRTCWVSRPELLSQLINTHSPTPEPPNLHTSLQTLQWSLLRNLRCAPALPAYNATPTSAEFHLEDIRAARFSELDAFVRSFPGKGYAGEYRRITTKLFLAQRFCFGFPQILSLVDLVLRFLLCYAAATQVVRAAVTQSALPLSLLLSGGEWWPLVKVVGLTGAGHLYSGLKGYE
jgi:hypothetical protein